MYSRGKQWFCFDGKAFSFHQGHRTLQRLWWWTVDACWQLSSFPWAEQEYKSVNSCLGNRGRSQGASQITGLLSAPVPLALPIFAQSFLLTTASFWEAHVLQCPDRGLRLLGRFTLHYPQKFTTLRRERVFCVTREIPLVWTQGI